MDINTYIAVRNYSKYFSEALSRNTKIDGKVAFSKSNRNLTFTQFTHRLHHTVVLFSSVLNILSLTEREFPRFYLIGYQSGALRQWFLVHEATCRNRELEKRAA
jgi:hypothetical protein